MSSKPMWNVFDDRCATRLVLNRVADKWTVLIVARLARRTIRFGELKREIAGISQKMLTQTLRGLERDGLVARTVYPEVPLRVEYSLTPLGATLVNTLVQIKDWAEGNIEAVLAAQRAYDQAAVQPAQPQGPARVVRLASRAA
ncbi:MAG TPA: helix-turn-helix domain-containing protein [Burkholderiales bacterium]|nr:helix-turn-helix domain-containing protein [Burkholderiales bacterium]